MHDVVVVTGPPGAGKTAVSEYLVSLLDSGAYVAGDLFFGFIRNGLIDPWLPEAKDQNATVIEAAALAVGRLSHHFQVVYDGVVGPWYLPTFAEAGRLGGLHYAVLLPPLAICVERVGSRVDHGFTDLDAAAYMWRDFDRATSDLGRHVLDDLTSSKEIAQQIARRVSDGTLRYEGGGDPP